MDILKSILFVIVVIFIWLVFVYKDKGPEDPFATFESAPPREVAFPDPGCEGKRNCSEMLSCEEAKYYMANCPGGSRLDPDSDGIPCEELCTGN